MAFRFEMPSPTVNTSWKVVQTTPFSPCRPLQCLLIQKWLNTYNQKMDSKSSLLPRVGQSASSLPSVFLDVKGLA